MKKYFFIFFNHFHPTREYKLNQYCVRTRVDVNLSVGNAKKKKMKEFSIFIRKYAFSVFLFPRSLTAKLSAC